jgi:signal transduction histidine kinase
MAADIAELEGLVEESLSYSRLSVPAELTLARERVPLRPWLEGLAEANRDLLGALRLRIEVDPAHPEASFDRQLMTRAVQNLVRNALQHARHDVSITVADAAGVAAIIVDDDGPGVPPEHREAIFLPFHRIDGSRSRDTGGHGLGLAIARRIFDAHGAMATVEDSPLGGARFRVTLATGDA